MKGIGLLPDLLADVPLRRRLAREIEDARYIRAHRGLMASAASLKRDAQTWPGLAGILEQKDFRPYKPGVPIDLVICARVDLDHPIYFPDNQFTDCADCGCRLQHRPDTPATSRRVCVCCAARRLRAVEKPDG